MVDSCLTVTVIGNANIELVEFGVDCTPDACTTCNTPCDVVVNIKWTNTGSVAGTFTPGYTVDGTLYTYDDVTLNVGASHAVYPLLALTTLGDHVICASPPN